MISTQQILNNIVNMQRDTQQALPVIPNNGNPGGANNMPHTGTPVAQPQAQPAVQDKFAWLKPSPSMDNVRRMIAEKQVVPSQNAPMPVRSTP